MGYMLVRHLVHETVIRTKGLFFSSILTLKFMTSVKRNRSMLQSLNLLKPVEENDRILISATQGEILLMLSEGYTNSAIAKMRGTSLRAAETLVQRTFASMGIKNDEDFNPRVLAVRMWQQGKVVVK